MVRQGRLIRRSGQKRVLTMVAVHLSFVPCAYILLGRICTMGVLVEEDKMFGCWDGAVKSLYNLEGVMRAGLRWRTFSTPPYCKAAVTCLEQKVASVWINW